MIVTRKNSPKSRAKPFFPKPCHSYKNHQTVNGNTDPDSRILPDSTELRQNDQLYPKHCCQSN